MAFSRFSILREEEDLNPAVLKAFVTRDEKALADKLKRPGVMNPHEMVTYIVKAAKEEWSEGLQAVLGAWGVHKHGLTLHKGVRAELLSVASDIIGGKVDGQIHNLLGHTFERVVRAEMKWRDQSRSFAKLTAA